MDGETLSHLFESLPYVVIFADLNGKLLFANSAFTKLYGWEKREGESLSFLFPESDQDWYKHQLEKQIASDELLLIEAVRIAKGGKKIYVSSTIRRILDKSGKLLGLLIADRALPDEIRIKTLSQELIDKAPNAMIIANPSGQIVLANRQMEKMFGYKKEELIGKEVKLLLPERLDTLHKQHRTTFLKEPKALGMGEGCELLGRKKDCSEFPIEISLSPVPFEGVVYVSAAIRDVSKRKKREKKFRDLLESTPDAMIIVKSGNIELVNSQTEQLFGYTKSEIVQQPIEMLIPDRFRSPAEDALDSIMTLSSSGEIITFNKMSEQIFGYHKEDIIGKKLGVLFPEFVDRGFKEEIESKFKKASSPFEGIRKSTRGKTALGTTFSAEISLSKVTVDRSPLFTLITRDVTEHEGLDRLKKEFVSTVSHELRTPLTAIKGSIDLLLAGRCGEVSEQVRHFLEIAARNSSHLIDLIGDILDMEKIEAGKMEFKAERIDLLALLKQVIEDTGPYAETYGVQLKLNDETKEPLVLSLDARRLTQVLTNLISNAIKFSPKGEDVTLSCDDLGDKVRISVADHGPGIDEEFRKRLFQRFSQHDSSDKKSTGGTGLGLYISKLIVDRLGGVIDVISVPGKGATFYVELNKTEWVRHKHKKTHYIVV